MGYKEQWDEAVKAEQTESVRAKYMTLTEEGETVIGRFLGTGEVISSINDKPYNQYLFDTDEGLVKFPLSSTVDIECSKIFKEGEVYRIEYLGEQKTQKGFKVKDFDIRHVLNPFQVKETDTEKDTAEGGKK